MQRLRGRKGLHLLYVFGYLCDRLRSLRVVVVSGTLLLGLLIATFPAHDNRAFLYVSIALVGFLQQPLGPMLDSWVLKHLAAHGREKSYGTVRGFGSIGWSTAALFTAYLIAGFGWNMMFLVCASACLLLILTALSIPEPPSAVVRGPTPAAHPGRIGPTEALAELARNAPYRYMLLVVFFLYLGVQTAYNFLGLVISGTGGGVIALGWTFFVDAGSEIPAMFLSVWLLRRFAPKTVMIAAIALYILRFAIILHFQTPWAVALTSILQGSAFGLMLTSFRNFVHRVAPVHLQTTALTLSDAVFLSLTVIVGGVLGGWIIEAYSVMALMGACMACAVAALLLLLAGRRIVRTQDTEGARVETVRWE